MSDCPAVERLALLVGDAPPEDAGLVEHLESCESCQRRLEEITSESTLDIRRHSHETPPDAMLRRLKELPAGLFAAPAFSEFESLGGVPAKPSPPSIEGFAIEGELGAGGMGVVYRAVQIGLGRTVAIKVLQAGAVASEGDLSRFRSEAEAVARLHHPNIVEVFQIGEWRRSTSDPRLPFFVQEFIAGGSLDAALAGRPAPPQSAARLASAMAKAIAHAHERGIVHRDLKPSNILLEFENGAGNDERRIQILSNAVPKVADFGLAKRLDGDAGRTASGAIVGTPGYMAPEQARGDSASVGPRTDVYGLGAILYEMLTGRPPFQGVDLAQSILLVLYGEPAAPRRLQPAVPRDLETICLKCLEKEPARRYRSARDLADDLDRFLSGQPIVARPIGAFGKVWKWAKRRPSLAAVSAALLLVVLGSVVSLSVLYAKAEAARKQAVEDRIEADTARVRAESAEAGTKSINEFFIRRILQAPRPKGHGLGKDVSLKEALDAAVPTVAAAFTGQPAIEASIRDALGNTYHRMGQPKAAAEQIRLAYELRLKALGPDDPETLSSQNNRAMTLLQLGDARNAVPLLRDLLSRREAKFGAEAASTMDTRHNLGGSLWQLGRLEEAERLFRENLALRRRVLGEEHTETIGSLEILGSFLRQVRPSSESTEIAERMVMVNTKRHGPTHPVTLQSRHNLAFDHQLNRRCSEALVEASALLADRRKVQGPDHAETLVTENNVATLLLELNRPVEAEPLLRHVLAVESRELPADHPTLLKTQQNLALALFDLKKRVEAEAMLRQLLATQESAKPVREEEVAGALATLGWLLVEVGKAAEAEPMLRRATSLRAKLLPASNWRHADVQSVLGGCLMSLGRLQEAEPLIVPAFERLAKDQRVPRRFVLEAATRGLRLAEKAKLIAEIGRWKGIIEELKAEPQNRVRK